MVDDNILRFTALKSSLNLFFSYFLIFFLIGVCHTSSMQKKQKSKTNILAKNFLQLIHLAKISIFEKNYQQLWKILAPSLQNSLLKFSKMIAQSSALEIKYLAHDLKIPEEHLTKLKSPNNFFYGLENDHLELLKIYLSKPNIFQQLTFCPQYKLLPNGKKSSAGLKNKNITSLRSVNRLSKNQGENLKTVYYMCRGFKPIQLQQNNYNDWRVNFRFW